MAEKSRRGSRNGIAKTVRARSNGRRAEAVADRVAVKPRKSRKGVRPGARQSGAKSEPEIDPELRSRLIQEVEDLLKRLRVLHPGYTPPPFSPEGLLNLLHETTGSLPKHLQSGLLDKVKGVISEDLLDADTWKGMWLVLNSSMQYQSDVLKRRVVGEYETDEWGLDREFLDAVIPFFEFMYKTYWRVEMTGLENIPDEGRALLVSNHSGQLPWDGSMLGTGILKNHPNNRLLRTLYATWFPTLPFFSDLLVKCGQVLATEDNGIRLLENDELVAVYPEGYKGVGKLYKDRYRLARFGRGGFVRMALKTQAPMLPVSIVGAEETYISLYKSSFLAKLTGFPYFPLSPTFPWTGLFGFIPLPTKWYIDIGKPIPTDRYKPNSENNLMLTSQLTDQVRNVVQDTILSRLAKRRSVFLG